MTHATNWEWINHGHESVALDLVTEFYTDKKANRSGVPKINHIHEGLTFMSYLGAADESMQAYCLHPLLQSYDDLAVNWLTVCQTNDVSPEAILLAMEYRNKANIYLCSPATDLWDLGTIRKEVGLLLPEVRHMLLADKWQNRKDFIKYHLKTHDRAAQLEIYFDQWLEYLDIESAFEIMRINKIDTDTLV